MDTSRAVTNVEKTTFVQFASSAREIQIGSIMPDRFSSTSSPGGGSVVTPELSSISTTEPAVQKSSGLR